MKVKQFLDDLVGTTTDVSVLLREACIVALFCILFFAPETFKNLLGRIGISKVSTAFGDIDVASAGGSVANINRGLSDSIAKLQEIQSTSSDGEAKDSVAKVTDYLKGLQQEAETTDESIKTTLVNQQAAAPAPTAKVSGYLFLGKADKDQLHWVGDGAKNVVPATLSPKLTVGEKFNVAIPAYLRDAPSGGKVIGVVRSNAQVQVLTAPTCTPAMAGGFFCWAKVQPL
jgi:hypothetical protein